MVIKHIISGGQTGVDRAALDAAMETGIECGGWCPKGRWAEDGVIDARYPLRETDEAEPAVRTRKNVEESDGTLILSPKPLTGGTAITQAFAKERERPVLVIDPFNVRTDQVATVFKWIQREKITSLNVAGPRESEAAGVYAVTRVLVTEILHRSADQAGSEFA